jgi:hypothetical protein
VCLKRAPLQVVKALQRAAAFSKIGELSARGNRIYRLDPTAMPPNLDIWKAAPYVVASLLATYIPKNEVSIAALMSTGLLYSDC